MQATPDNHLAASPYCRMISSALGGGCEGEGWPTIGAAIIFGASVEIVSRRVSAPNDHFGAGPHCRVAVSWGKWIVVIGGYPNVTRARTRRSTYYREMWTTTVN